MKSTFIIAFLFFLCLAADAQVKPIYFKGDVITSDKDAATSYAVYGKLSNENIWTFKRFDLYDNLIQTGAYADSLLSKPHGTFTFYSDINLFNTLNRTSFKIKDKTRFKSQEGNYVNGIEQGKWIVFYPDGNIFNIQNFQNGKLQGEFKTFDKLGKLIISGNYKNNERDGEWVFSTESRKDFYEMGVLKTSEAIKKERKN